MSRKIGSALRASQYHLVYSINTINILIWGEFPRVVTEHEGVI